MLNKITTFGSVKKKMRSSYFFALCMLLSQVLSAQNQLEVSLHSSGKINLVIGVLVAIFLGILAFLVYLERKLNHLEKQIKNNE